MVVDSLIDIFLEPIYLFPGRVLILLFTLGKRNPWKRKLPGDFLDNTKHYSVIASTVFWLLLIAVLIVKNNTGSGTGP